MMRMQRCFAFSTALVLVIGLGGHLLAAPPHDDATEQEEDVQALARPLVEELASKFTPEHEQGYWGSGMSLIDTDADPARKEDAARVRAARERLEQLGTAAFPALIEAQDDERYSYSQVVAAWNNWSVGAACYLILKRQIETYRYGYKSRSLPDGGSLKKPSYLAQVAGTVGLDAWWEQRKDRNLRELQTEAVQWTIEREKAAGFVDVQQQQEILVPLQARLRELQQEAVEQGEHP